VRERVADADVEVTSITEDSRRVAPGACFACRPGGHHDGHELAADAVAAGAVALLVERVLALPVPQARVDDVLGILGPAAARLYGEPSLGLTCLGVTGTAGKTTTTMLLAAIARAAGRSAGVIGSDGVLVDGEPVAMTTSTPTMPQADQLQALLALMRDRAVDVVAMEVTSRALDQHRVDGTHFAVACFTNLSHEHLDDHGGSMEEYFTAKARLFVADRTRAVATNVDDPYGRRIATQARAQGLDVWTFAIDDADADLRGRVVTVGASGITVEVTDRRDDGRAHVAVPLIGRFNAANVLGAAATARAAGIPLDVVAEGLGRAGRVPGRTEPIDRGQDFGVMVDYAHSPGELAAVLASARELTSDGGRVVVVFGCGGDRDPSKRPLMGAAAGEGADVAVLTSDNPRREDPAAIAAQAAAGLAGTRAEVVVELDRRVAIAHALGAARPGDVVVIAGKGAETGQTVGDAVRPFDDRLVAGEELEALGWS
jgi:UDP-N-acetylmuramoyl-L-alanyl-D-glutamate--2,6-diaminopimelate ligase